MALRAPDMGEATAMHLELLPSGSRSNLNPRVCCGDGVVGYNMNLRVRCGDGFPYNMSPRVRCGDGYPYI
jgi:hypothetical protein